MNAPQPSFAVSKTNPTIANAEFEDYDRGSGRPPIPRRPSIPERPPEDPGSADEDDEDEKPQVIVLKEGKHLTEREAENGLPPLPDPITAPPAEESTSQDVEPSEKKSNSSKPPALSFSTSKSGFKSSASKRKAVGQPSYDNDNHGDNITEKGKQSGKTSKAPPSSNKKQKKNSKTKTLLSFGDDA
ncbi:hypothetical protein AX17_006514 [Amanita inopinata Kibby_2008]|nr:hypothetical protein AX17_006514 [Amanita inopinata Kibby_2008]